MPAKPTDGLPEVDPADPPLAPDDSEGGMGSDAGGSESSTTPTPEEREER